MAGPDLDLRGQGEQLLIERAKDVRRALLGVDRQVRPSDVADEQRVPGKHRPRLRRSSRVGEREGGVLGSVAGSVECADAHPAQLELPPVLEGLVCVLGRGEAVHVDRRARRRRQSAVPGYVVRVVVSLEHVLDRDPQVAGGDQVVVDLELGVHHGGDPGLGVAH